MVKRSNPDNERLGRDLHQLLYSRYKTVSEDWCDTAERAGLSDDDILSSIMTIMLTELINATLAREIERDQFVEICRHSYDLRRRMRSGPTRTA